jgi:single-strand DNA-binding protein
MNKVILIGRLTKDVETRHSNDTSVSRYSLAVDRRFKQEGQQSADFINCVAFGKQSEFAEKYLRKGMRIAVEGRIQTGSYKNRDGQTVYTTDVVVEAHEFCESKQDNQSTENPSPHGTIGEEFMDIPDDICEELPFN